MIRYIYWVSFVSLQVDKKVGVREVNRRWTLPMFACSLNYYRRQADNESKIVNDKYNNDKMIQVSDIGTRKCEGYIVITTV